MTDDVLQTAQWLVSGRLAPYAVDEKSVVAMAKKLLEALEALEASQGALNETLAKSAEALKSTTTLGEWAKAPLYTQCQFPGCSRGAEKGHTNCFWHEYTKGDSP